MKKLITSLCFVAISVNAEITEGTASGSLSIAIGNFSEATDSNSIAIGTFSSSTGLDSIAIGDGSKANTEHTIAIGSGAISGSGTASHAIAIGQYSSATGEGSVAIGANSEANEANTVSVGSYGNERRIINVQNPHDDTDVANKRYVDNVFSSLSSTGGSGLTESEIDVKDVETLNSANSYTDTQVLNAYTYTDSVFSSISMSGGISESEVDAKDQAILNSAKSYTDEKFDSLDKKIDTLEQTLTKELRVGVASAIALGVTPVFQNDKDNALGIGFGNYEGESAMAINYARKIASNQVLQLGTSLNAAHRAFKVGYSVSW